MSRVKMLMLYGLLSTCAWLHAQNFGAGTCTFPNTLMLPTIQGAINAAPPGTTIAVCPGIYPEQVTVNKPVSLLGRAFGNASRAVIAPPPGALAPNITNQRGIPVFAQLLILSSSASGPVNITGITVDGTGALDSNGQPICEAGIFYATGTSGTVNEVTARNQVGLIDAGIQQACGFGIWAENGAASTQSVTIQNSSVHDFGDTGIAAYNQAAAALGTPTLNAIVYSNFVTPSTPLGEPVYSTGIDSTGAASSISNNFLDFGLVTAEYVTGITGRGAPSNVMISANTVADLLRGVFAAQAIQVTDGVAQSNRISAFGNGNGIQTQHSTITSNKIVNSKSAAISGSCADDSTINQNILNDAPVALFDEPNALLSGGQLDNIDQIFTAPDCH